MGRKRAKWESELWSYLSSSDGEHCPGYRNCPHRLGGSWCMNDNKQLIKQLLEDDKFRPENYSIIRNIFCVSGSDIGRSMEKLADEYLRRGGISGPPVPTELALLADERRTIEVRTVPLTTHSGGLWQLNDEWVIHLNRNDSPARQRMALFHEVFHILAHCRATPTPLFKKEGFQQGSFNELAADCFALHVLTPTEWLKEKWAEASDLDKIAEIFIVPRAAAWFTLKCNSLI